MAEMKSLTLNGVKYDIVDANAVHFAEAAAVGQTIRVSAVDENGVPTAWEAVDMASGGGGSEWELLDSFELPDGSEEVSGGLAITLPEGYKEFILRAFLAVPSATSNTTVYPRVIASTGTQHFFPASFWDYYPGTKAEYLQLYFETADLGGVPHLRMSGFETTSVEAKKNNLTTSGWFDKSNQGVQAARWAECKISRVIAPGSYYTLWGRK